MEEKSFQRGRISVFLWNEAREGECLTWFGRSFNKVGASNEKLRPHCFLEEKTEGTNLGTSRNKLLGVRGRSEQTSVNNFKKCKPCTLVSENQQLQQWLDDFNEKVGEVNVCLRGEHSSVLKPTVTAIDNEKVRK